MTRVLVGVEPVLSNSLPQALLQREKEESGKKLRKRKFRNTSLQRPVGGLPRPSPTPTHQNCPSCPVGWTPRAGGQLTLTSRPGRRLRACRPPQLQTPLLPPPGINLSSGRSAWEPRGECGVFQKRPRGAPAWPRQTPPCPTLSNHQPSLRPAFSAPHRPCPITNRLCGLCSLPHTRLVQSPAGSIGCALAPRLSRPMPATLQDWLAKWGGTNRGTRSRPVSAGLVLWAWTLVPWLLEKWGRVAQFCLFTPFTAPPLAVLRGRCIGASLPRGLRGCPRVTCVWVVLRKPFALSPLAYLLWEDASGPGWVSTVSFLFMGKNSVGLLWQLHWRSPKGNNVTIVKTDRGVES